MPRLMLTDKRWEMLLHLMKSTGRIYNKPEHRNTFEGILYRLRTGIPWRDLPKEFVGWSSIFRRFNLWSKKGILSYLFKELAKYSDFYWVFIDGSIIGAHQHSTGAATTDSECIGKSLGGNSTKIHLAVDSSGFPIYFELSEGQRNDITHAQSLVEHTRQAKIVIADKGYDSDIFRQFIESEGM
jgi:transposase